MTSPPTYRMTETQLARYRFANAPDWLRMTTTTAGDRYSPQPGVRYYIIKHVPRCQSATNANKQCSRSALDSSGQIQVDGDVPRCKQHGGGEDLRR
jgi:hypothetical protein